MSIAKSSHWPHQLLDALGHHDPRITEMQQFADTIRSAQPMLELLPDGTILSANALFLDMTGYRADEIVGQPCHQLLFTDTGAEGNRQALATRGSGECAGGRQIRRRAKDGREIWMHTLCSPVVDSHGNVVKLVEFSTDITAQKRRQAEVSAKLTAIERSMARIEFDLDGRIRDANPLFLSVTGYRLDEIVGKHHRIFVPEDDRESPAYQAFWEKLRSGQFDHGQYRRIAKDGHDVWIEATYNPLLDLNGKPYGVIKFATDITARRQRDADVANQLKAVDRAQAIIEFTLEGKILAANSNFLSTTGYRQEDIVGKHHRIFVTETERESADYQRFWSELAAGEAKSGRFRRIGRNGKDVWLEASYNPILDAKGTPYKVVKYATDITPAILEMMGEIQTFATVIRTGSSEIAAGNEDLARRTEAQAASVEQTAAAMEELTSTVQQNAESARQAKGIASDVADAAKGADSAVQSVMDSMAEIERSSRRIADIIGLIDGIAFQTNLLALNAAVEAARAGEHGRGFAVVAGEIRTLSQRSAVAAQEIKALVSQSTHHVHDGVGRTRQAGEVMTGIVQSVQQVAALMQEIATASAEQASGIAQINIAITQMDGSLQQNAALVEEAAAAARSLDAQSDGLMAIVSSYLH